MNRRDTILIAVLINAGLLVILFATAMTAEPEIAVAAPEPAAVVEEAPQLAVVTPPPPAPEPEPIVPAETPKATFVDVTIKRGDNLEKIARANGTTVAALMKLNGLTDSRLQIGETLRVPLSDKAPEPKKDEEPGYYVVESGDNPWLLASKLHIPLNDLLELNQLDEERARRLKPGDRIRIK